MLNAKPELRLVSAHMRIHPSGRNIIGAIHRHSIRLEDQTRRLERRYKNIDNAVACMTRFMMKNGYVGDICEIYHAYTGLQIGWIKMTTKGRLNTYFVFD